MVESPPLLLAPQNHPPNHTTASPYLSDIRGPLFSCSFTQKTHLLPPPEYREAHLLQDLWRLHHVQHSILEVPNLNFFWVHWRNTGKSCIVEGINAVLLDLSLCQHTQRCSLPQWSFWTFSDASQYDLRRKQEGKEGKSMDQFESVGYRSIVPC